MIHIYTINNYMQLSFKILYIISIKFNDDKNIIETNFLLYR